ncbi:CHAT domain-containing protein [Mycena crocata]|nr:CHAT domain-containing protein [Mycena crocata]
MFNVPTVPDLELSQTIQELRHLIHESAPEDPDLPRWHQQLGVALLRRYNFSGDVDSDLTPALQNLQIAVALTPEESPLRPICLQSLAQSLRVQYHRFKDPKALQTALYHDREAVKLTPKGHPDRARCLHSLAVTLEDQYVWQDSPDFEPSLQYNQEAVDLTPDGHPDKAERLHSLAQSLLYRHEVSDNPGDHEAAMEQYQKAVDLTAQEHPDRAWHLKSLAGRFTDRFATHGNVDDLEASLQINQQALDLTPTGHPDRARCLHIVGASYRDRYQRFGNLKDLEIALHKHKESLDLTEDQHPAKYRRLQNLSVIYNDLYERLRDVKDLEDSIARGREAMNHVLENDVYKVFFWINLAHSLTDRYLRLGDIKDLEIAMQRNQQAVDHLPDTYSDVLKARCLHNLARSFADRYERLGDANDLEVALKKGQEALYLLHSNNAAYQSDRAAQLQNLAVLFITRYRKMGNTEDLEEALRKNQEALEFTDEGHPSMAQCLQNLALAFIDRYKRFKDPDDLPIVHSHYSRSFDILGLSPEESWEAAVQWASFAKEFQPSYCKTAYTNAFKLLPDILWIGHTISVRHDAIRRLDIAEVASTAAKTCILSSDLTTAVEFIEQGLATVFQQILQLKTNVEGLDPNLTEKFQNLSTELYGGKTEDPMTTVNDRNELLALIRKQPGHEYFLLRKPYEVLRDASSEGPVVILNGHADGCDGIIVVNPVSQPIHVALPYATLLLLKSQRNTLKDLLNCCAVRTRGERSATRLFGQREYFSSKTTEERFEEMLAWLWTAVVEPVYQALNSHGVMEGRLWWLPTGAFTGLPLHACPPTDEFIHSYAATLGSLLDGHAKRQSTVPHKVGVVAVTHTGPGGAQALEGVEKEIQNICSIVQAPYIQLLEGEKATPAAVELQLQDCSWVHLACHGSQDQRDPTNSCLELYGGRLKLQKILQMPLSNAQFVFLAACETAMGDSELLNESFHLGGGFIAAGFRGAVGTMWSMRDVDGPVVAEIFYSHLFRNEQAQAGEAAEALHLAIKELQKRKVSFERWIPFIHMGV